MFCFFLLTVEGWLITVQLLQPHFDRHHAAAAHKHPFFFLFCSLHRCSFWGQEQTVFWWETVNMVCIKNELCDTVTWNLFSTWTHFFMPHLLWVPQCERNACEKYFCKHLFIFSFCVVFFLPHCLSHVLSGFALFLLLVWICCRVLWILSWPPLTLSVSQFSLLPCSLFFFFPLFWSPETQWPTSSSFLSPKQSVCKC